MRPLARRIFEVSTPSPRSCATTASATGSDGGSAETKDAERPTPASATATLASPPPNVATNCGDCRKRSKPGGARRSMISPNVTVVLNIELSGDGDHVDAESGVHGREPFEGQHGGRRRTGLVEELEAEPADASAEACRC